jgi:hypothetical protein
MNVRDNIEAGKYNTELSYDFVTTPVNDDMTIRQAREHEAEQKRLKSGHRQKYHEDRARLEEQFAADLAEEHGLVGHPKEKLLYSLAYERGHSGGFRDVAGQYEEMADLLKP